MKVCVLQPYYSFEKKDTQKCFDDMIALLDQCDDSYDLIVMPEYSDVPAVQGSKEGFHESIEKYNATVLQKAKLFETALKRFPSAARVKKVFISFVHFSDFANL